MIKVDDLKRYFESCNVNPAFYANRDYPTDSILPWDMIDVGITKNFLLRERRKAYEGVITPDCRHGCSGCGANKLLKEVRCDG